MINARTRPSRRMRATYRARKRPVAVSLPRKLTVMQLTDVLHAVDAHAEGELTRVVVGGLPPSAGVSMAQKRLELMADDSLRRYLLGEPHDHLCLHAVCVYPPSDPAAAAGMVIMESTDDPSMSGSNTICTATVLLETGMVPMDEPERAASSVSARRSCTRASSRPCSRAGLKAPATVGALPAIRPSISGRAWLTGTHQLGRDPRDPLGRGFGLADTCLRVGAQWPPTDHPSGRA
jgi:proline racemase